MLIIKESDPNSIKIACQHLKDGKIISFATDTIYGVAVDASNSDAVARLYQIKQRSQQKPIAIFVKNLEIAQKIFTFDEKSLKIAKKYLPGHLTMVLKTKNNLKSKQLTLANNLNLNNDGFLGFRIIKKEFIENLLEKFGGILAVTSANISGTQSSSSSKEVEKQFKIEQISQPNLDLLIEGSNSTNKLGSTVIKIDNNQVQILRQGLISIEI